MIDNNVEIDCATTIGLILKQQFTPLAELTMKKFMMKISNDGM